MKQTTMGSVIATRWKSLERHAHTLTPYHSLAQSPSAPGSTILAQRKSWPFAALFAMAYHRHFFAAFLASIAIISEILVITLAGVPYAAGQILLESQACNYTSILILVLMVCGIACMMVWRRKAPDLPRAPDTVLGVMSYVADSKMLYDFEGCEYLEGKYMDNRIQGLGKRYRYGRCEGVDGQFRWMVDEEKSFSS
jgi:hypothetical protein